MGMTFLTLQQELADRLNLDQTQAIYSARLKRWLNLTQQDISSRFPFSWQLAREIVQTVVDKTAGTVSIVNGSTSVTGTATSFAATDKYSFINFASGTNWYQITNVAGQVLTLDKPVAEVTAATSTYTLRKRYYSLTNDIERVFDVSQTNTPQKLQQIGIFTYDSYQPDPNINNVSVPTAYYLFGQDPGVATTAAPIRQMSFFPSPDAVYNIEVKYSKYISDMVNDTDIPTIPQQWMSVLLAGAESFGEKYLNGDDDVPRGQYEYLLARMIEQESSHDDYFPVLGSTDNQTQSQFLPFPANFAQPS